MWDPPAFGGTVALAICGLTAVVSGGGLTWPLELLATPFWTGAAVLAGRGVVLDPGGRPRPRETFGSSSLVSAVGAETTGGVGRGAVTGLVVDATGRGGAGVGAGAVAGAGAEAGAGVGALAGATCCGARRAFA